MNSIKSLVGKYGVFNSYDDLTWSHYAGKRAEIVSFYFNVGNGADESEICLKFENGDILHVSAEEVTLVN